MLRPLSVLLLGFGVGCGQQASSVDPPPDAVATDARVLPPPDQGVPATCPDDFPVACPATADQPADCWTLDTDCSTRVTCSDGSQHACGTGYVYDCATDECNDPTAPPPPPPPPSSGIPSWLVGLYVRNGKQENNVFFHGDDRSLTFRADGTYSQSIGTSSASSGAFTVANDTLTFTTGALTGTTLSLSTSFDATCRILSGFGSALWRHGEVTGCPTGTRVSTADCADVGTFTRKQHSGQIGPTGSGSESDFTTTVTLGPDRFYTYNDSSFKTTCFDFTCKSLASDIQTVVGDWSESAGAPPFQISTLHTWAFTPATCP